MELRFAVYLLDDFDHFIEGPVGMSGIELGECSFVLHWGLGARLDRSPHIVERVGVVVGIDLKYLVLVCVAGDSHVRVALIADPLIAA